MTTGKRVVDARNSTCGALWLTIPEVRQGSFGDEVEVWLTDPNDKSDIAQWTAKARNEIVDSPKDASYEKVTIRKLRLD